MPASVNTSANGRPSLWAKRGGPHPGSSSNRGQRLGWEVTERWGGDLGGRPDPASQPILRRKTAEQRLCLATFGCRTDCAKDTQHHNARRRRSTLHVFGPPAEKRFGRPPRNQPTRSRRWTCRDNQGVRPGVMPRPSDWRLLSTWGAIPRRGGYARIHERRHPHPVRHRAGRPARRRATAAAGLRRAAQAGRRSGWPRRSPARRSRPPPWSTRRTCGWSDGEQAQHWNSRGHFFAAAAEAMRRILVEQRPPQAAPTSTAAAGSGVDLDDADRRRRAAGRRPAGPGRGARPAGRATTRTAAELVKLRYFAGLTVEEAAEALGISAGDRRPALGLRPGLAATPSCSAASRPPPTNLRHSRGEHPAAILALDRGATARERAMTDRLRQPKRSSSRPLEIGPPERAGRLPGPRPAAATPELRAAGRGAAAPPTTQAGSFLEPPAASPAATVDRAAGRRRSRHGHRPVQAAASRSARAAWASVFMAEQTAARSAARSR